MDLDKIPELDLSQIFHQCTTRMRDLAEIQQRISWIKIHPITAFCFYPVMFSFEYIPLKLFIFIWNTTDYFYIAHIEHSSSLTTASNIFYMTAPFLKEVWHHSKHPQLGWGGNQMTFSKLVLNHPDMVKHFSMDVFTSTRLESSSSLNIQAF